MKHGWNDPERELRARFEALRLSDAALAGSFDTSWHAARSRLDARRPAGLSRWRALLTAAGVTAVVAAAALALTFDPPRPSVDEAIAQARPRTPKLVGAHRLAGHNDRSRDIRNRPRPGAAIGGVPRTFGRGLVSPSALIPNPE